MKQIKELNYQNQYGDVNKIKDYDFDEKMGQIVFNVEQINSLEGFNLYLKLDKTGVELLNGGISLDV